MAVSSVWMEPDGFADPDRFILQTESVSIIMEARPMRKKRSRSFCAVG